MRFPGSWQCRLIRPAPQPRRRSLYFVCSCYKPLSSQTVAGAQCGFTPHCYGAASETRAASLAVDLVDLVGTLVSRLRQTRT